MDVETTGLDPWTHEVVEIAILTDEREWHSKVRPAHPELADPWCAENIGWDMTAPTWSTVEPTIRSLLEDATFLAGQNVSFDAMMLLGMLRRHEQDWRLPKHKIDLVPLAWAGLGNTIQSYSLASIAAALGVPQEAPHTALDDARVAKACIERLRTGLSFVTDKPTYRPPI